MLPRPLSNLNFSHKELLAFTERINELAASTSNTSNTSPDQKQQNSTETDSTRFCAILGTPTRQSADRNNSPSLRTPLQSKK